MTTNAINQAIIYSPFNLDSCLAAGVLYRTAQLANKRVQTIPYSRYEPSRLPIGMDEILITGVDMFATDMTTILDDNPTANLFVQAYPNATHFGTKIMARLEAMKGMYTAFESQDGVGFTPSVALAALAISSDNKSFTDFELASMRALATVVHKYCIFDSMTAQEMALLYSNIKNIRKAATGATTPYALSPNAVPDTDYEEKVQQIRQVITNGMRMAWYPGANGSGFTTPTIAVTELDAMLAMRFINYSHDDVISYEDTRNCRVYRIHSSRNLEWYVKRFEPIDVWTEGKLVFLKVDLQQHVR